MAGAHPGEEPPPATDGNVTDWTLDRVYAAQAAAMMGEPAPMHQQVADVWWQAWRAGKPTTDAVRKHFEISYVAAAQRVARARKAGLIPETTRGRPVALPTSDRSTDDVVSPYANCPPTRGGSGPLPRRHRHTTPPCNRATPTTHPNVRHCSGGPRLVRRDAHASPPRHVRPARGRYGRRVPGRVAGRSARPQAGHRRELSQRGPVTPRWYADRFQSLAGDAGLPVIRLHDARHGYGSHLLHQGVPVPFVAQVMGHASPAITMSVYAHALRGGTDQRVRAATSAAGL
jgi:hypothetical protein